MSNPIFKKNMMRDDIILWKAGVPDGYGNTTYGEPILIKGNWQEKTDIVVEESGEEWRSRSDVYLDRKLVIGDWLALIDVGEDIPSPLPYEPSMRENATEIRRISRLVDSKRRKVSYVARV